MIFRTLAAMFSPQKQAKPMNFVGTGKRLDDIDLPRMGKLIGVGEDEIHAILDVESVGRGFDSQNRSRYPV